MGTTTMTDPWHAPCDQGEFNAWLDGNLGRITYHLTFARDESRRVWGGGIDGKRLPNAYGEGEAPGDWSQPDICEQKNVHDLIREAWRGAVAEAVHEVCEWFRLDGEILLDPHDERWEQDIFDRCHELADQLWSLVDHGRLTRT